MCRSANRKNGGKSPREKACALFPKGTYFPHHDRKSLEGVKQALSDGTRPSKDVCSDPMRVDHTGANLDPRKPMKSQSWGSERGISGGGREQIWRSWQASCSEQGGRKE